MIAKMFQKIGAQKRYAEKNCDNRAATVWLKIADDLFGKMLG
jgi:hypothetical protein